MKKPYIVPESRLFSIDLKENIAASDQIWNGQDIVTANALIKFTFGTEPCRGKYTDTIPVTVGDNAAFMDYYEELNREVMSGKYANGFQAYFNCFKYATYT